MKKLVEYITEKKKLQEINESIVLSTVIASSMMSSHKSSGGYSSSSNDNKSTTGKNISAILRVCSFIAGGCLASLTGVAAVVAGVVLLVLSIINIPYGDFIDDALDAAKKLKKNNVSESFDEEIEYIDEGLLDKFKEIKNNLKEKSLKAFAKICAKNKKIAAILNDIKKEDNYENAIQSGQFNEIAKLVGDYFKKNKNYAKEAGEDLKNDKTSLADA